MKSFSPPTRQQKAGLLKLIICMRARGSRALHGVAATLCPDVIFLHVTGPTLVHFRTGFQEDNFYLVLGVGSEILLLVRSDMKTETGLG
jgi:hypothetical protein